MWCAGSSTAACQGRPLGRFKPIFTPRRRAEYNARHERRRCGQIAVVVLVTKFPWAAGRT